MRVLLFLAISMQLVAESPRLAEAPDFKTAGWTSLLNGKDLTGWTARDGKPHTWFTTQAVHWSKQTDPKRLAAAAMPGPTMVNGTDGRTVDLVSTLELGDAEFYVEFMIPPKSNSGLYVQGLYEVQILDSFGVATLGVHDCGAIYERWINGKGVGGSIPIRNASRAPGEWQSFLIRFRAPRFDASGNKVENGRFIRVEHNGVVIHENQEVPGPTRASMEFAEAAKRPLMIQGDHGPVALRNIYAKPLKLK